MAIPTSNRWAHLLYLGEHRKPIMAKGPNGVPYVADTHGPLYRTFLCDCGHEFEMPAEAFPGRRKLKTCGRPECPHNQPGKPLKHARVPTVIKSVSLSLDMAQRARDYALEHRTSFSAVVETALREHFLKQLLDD